MGHPDGDRGDVPVLRFGEKDEKYPDERRANTVTANSQSRLTTNHPRI
jgi:hypothetical protein